MSTFTAQVEFAAPGQSRWAEVSALVDTGSTFTWLPRDLLLDLGVNAREKREFETADGRVVERDVGVAQARISGREMDTLVVFAENGGMALLGAYTLEGFGLGADPSTVA